MSRRIHAEAIYDSLKSVVGIHDPDQVQATLERALRHMIPNWREEIPDCPGWYWLKPPGVSEPQLLLVEHATQN